MRELHLRRSAEYDAWAQPLPSTIIGACCRLTRAADEAIAYAYDCFNAVAAPIKLLSQSANVHVQGASISIVAVAPNTIEQLLASNNAVSTPRQDRQQCKFFVCELDPGSFANHSDVVIIDE